jgi:hypothetical protein
MDWEQDWVLELTYMISFFGARLPTPWFDYFQQNLRTSSEVKPRTAGRFRWTEKNFNELEQSGILAQKLSICGKLSERIFADLND